MSRDKYKYIDFREYRNWFRSSDSLNSFTLYKDTSMLLLRCEMKRVRR